MERRIVERVEDWDSRPFSGGHEGLRELSSAGFSGAVQAGGTWLFMLNGRIVGLFDGSIESVEDADGTAYGAPHQSLPLLYTMRAKAGDPRAKYYTNDTPISEVHQTLSSGSFTGYIELSENVLSGDYYQVYHGGRSMSAAFVGTSEQLITDEEAFERADGEVGIYKVYEVDIEITELPEPENSSTPNTAGGSPVQEAETGTDDPGVQSRGQQSGSERPDSTPNGSPAREDSTTDTSSRSGRSADRGGRSADQGRSEPDSRARSESGGRAQPGGDERSQSSGRGASDRGTGRDRTDRTDRTDPDERDRGGSRRRETGREPRRNNQEREQPTEQRGQQREERRSQRRDDRESQQHEDQRGRTTDRGTQDSDRSRRNRPGQSGGNVDPEDRTDQSTERSRARQDTEREPTDSGRRRNSGERRDTGTAGDERSTSAQQGSPSTGDSARSERGRERTSDADRAGRRTGDRAETPEPAVDEDPTPRQDRRAADPDGIADRTGSGRTDADPAGQNSESDAETGNGEAVADDQPSPDAATGTAAGTVEGEAAWRDAETIPSLDPDRTELPADSERGGDGSTAVTAASGSTPRSDGATEPDDDPGSAPEPASAPDQPDPETGATNGSSEPKRAAGDEQPAEAGNDMNEAFDAEVLEREDQIDRLQQRVSNLEADRDDLRTERDELARTADRLREEKEDLEAEIDHLESELAGLESEIERLRESGGAAEADVPASKRSVSAAEALAGTDLFVRYASKSKPTLDDMYSGNATPEDVNDNLRLEHHTRFESDEVVVDGQAFDEWLTGTLEYRFVDWFVTMLPYEIRDTGHTDALKDLFDAFPNIDRAELEADISLQYEEDGEEIREQQTFDVVIRDRMGNPLVVANLNDSRDPASQEMMVDLKETADRVKQTADSLGASFLVTKSFFAPGALETASEATSGGFLSRDSRESYVKLSRKSGYHLCLVEARGDDFHLNVPEL